VAAFHFELSVVACVAFVLDSGPWSSFTRAGLSLACSLAGL